MKKSILALLCMLFALFAAPMVYAADEDASDDSAASSAEEPLPPMIDSSDSAGS